MMCLGDGSDGDTRATRGPTRQRPRHDRQVVPTGRGVPWARPKKCRTVVSIENQQSHRARGGALITTICLEFYGHIGKTPNRRASLQTGIFH